MPLLTQRFDPDNGPIVHIGVSAPTSLQPRSGPDPKRRLVPFMIDTGASQTSISPASAAALDLPIIGLVTMQAATHTVQATEYLSDLYLPVGQPPYHFRDIRLLEFPLGGPEFHGLLGRDLLRHGLVEINGPADTFTLAF